MKTIKTIGNIFLILVSTLAGFGVGYLIITNTTVIRFDDYVKAYLACPLLGLVMGILLVAKLNK